MGDQVKLETDYGTLYIKNGGRVMTFVLHGSVRKGHHHQALEEYVQYLYDQGIRQINADHINFDFLDRRLDIRRGNRKLDIVYYKNGILYECELKTSRECGIDRTWEQIAEQLEHCTNYILLVPQTKIMFVEETLTLRGLNGVTVKAYDNL